ncbi:MAG: hypothetical protein LLG04_01305 [Parachlamydia sp.]|nr:hypothetical protein [Parachlamydia sp.]
MTVQENNLKIARERLSNPFWRMNNLYHIVDKEGNKIHFKMNPEQETLYRGMHYLNIILKSRQVGISTLIALIFLDRCLFNSNVSAGIICHTREDSEAFFRRIKFAYDNLPEEIIALRPAKSDTKNELSFNNGSSIVVGMLGRGSTLNYLHISEFGKISAKYPDKATEIITGSLNTLAPGQYAFIESTAEGRENVFFDMCKRAQDLKDSRKALSKLDWKFFFFPWMDHTLYRLNPEGVVIPTELNDYFDKIEAKTRRALDPEQRAWYAKKRESQGEYMKREYPSTPEEAFESATEGNYYSGYLTRARQEKRITKVFHDPTKQVHSAWDLGFADSTAIWLFQIDGQRINILEYYENSGEALPHYINWLKAKSYNYGTHLAPHDIAQHELGSGLTRLAISRNLGVNFTPVPVLPVVDGIEAVRNILNRCFFDEERCAMGIKMLDSYRKEWNDRHGCWSTKPRHVLKKSETTSSDAYRTKGEQKVLVQQV